MKKTTPTTTETRPLRIWWIPQVPMDPFFHPVGTAHEGALLLDALAEYDKFQLENLIKPDYSNAGGLEVKDGTEWIEWENENGDTIDNVSPLSAEIPEDKTQPNCNTSEKIECYAREQSNARSCMACNSNQFHVLTFEMRNIIVRLCAACALGLAEKAQTAVKNCNLK